MLNIVMAFSSELGLLEVKETVPPFLVNRSFRKSKTSKRQLGEKDK